MTSFLSAENGPIWIKFRRLVHNDMSTAVVWSKLKPDVECQYGGRLSEFNGMWSHSHLLHCRVQPLGEFTVTIPEPHATLQSAVVTWWNQCHDRATLQGVNSIRHIETRFSPYFIFCLFFNAVWALTSGGFRIVSDTLVYFVLYCGWVTLAKFGRVTCVTGRGLWPIDFLARNFGVYAFCRAQPR